MPRQRAFARRPARARSRSDRLHRDLDPLAPRGEETLPPASAPNTAGYGPLADQGRWLPEIGIASGLNVLAGIWLIIAPFVLGYDNGDPYWNDIVFGAIVAVLAFARVAGAYRATWMSSLNMLIGAWIFISAFWLDNTANAGTNDIILGAIVFLLALVSASATVESQTTRTRRLARR
jgi:hypothetical protein